jgi:predicted metal-dependent hydrolase
MSFLQDYWDRHFAQQTYLAIEQDVHWAKMSAQVRARQGLDPASSVLAETLRLPIGGEAVRGMLGERGD